MIKDKALEELFLTQKPHFDDHDVFMADLTKRLDAVEFIRQHQEASVRRYKMAMVAAFIVGIVSGAVTMVFILSTPADVPLFTFHFETSILLWFAKNSRPIAACGCWERVLLCPSIHHNDIRQNRRSIQRQDFVWRISSKESCAQYPVHCLKL